MPSLFFISSVFLYTYILIGVVANRWVPREQFFYVLMPGIQNTYRNIMDVIRICIILIYCYFTGKGSMVYYAS